MNKPFYQIDAATSQIDDAASKRAIVNRIRIIQPDALAVMQGGEVIPYHLLIHHNLTRSVDIPVLILNPDELTKEGVRARMDAPETIAYFEGRMEYFFHDQRRFNATGQVADMMHVFEETCAMVLQDGGEKLLATAQNLLDKIHKNYPPAPQSLEYFHELFQARYELRMQPPGKKRDAALEQFRPVMKQYSQLVMEAAREGSAPDLPTDRRAQIDTHLRDQMMAIPLPLLELFLTRHGMVFAADYLNYNAAGYNRGSCCAARGVVATLHDDAPVLHEELFHFADDATNYSKQFMRFARGFFRDENDKDRDWLGDAKARNLVDQLMKHLWNKSPLFEKFTAYSDADDHTIAMEFMVNLFHLDNMEMTPTRIEQVGNILHDIYPKRFRDAQAFDGNLRGLLAELLPKAWQGYEHFWEAVEDRNSHYRGRSI